MFCGPPVTLEACGSPGFWYALKAYCPFPVMQLDLIVLFEPTIMAAPGTLSLIVLCATVQLSLELVLTAPWLPGGAKFSMVRYSMVTPVMPVPFPTKAKAFRVYPEAPGLSPEMMAPGAPMNVSLLPGLIWAYVPLPR